jgi:hypothetical protein
MGVQTNVLSGEVVLLKPQASGSSTPSTAYSTLTYAATLTIDSSTGSNFRCALTGDVTIAMPTNPTDGTSINLWLTASSANRNVTLNAGIKIPTSSVYTSPITIASGKKARYKLQYDSVLNGGQWELISFVNGY